MRTVYEPLLNPRRFRGKSLNKRALYELEIFLREVFARLHQLNKVNGVDLRQAIKETALTYSSRPNKGEGME